MTKLVFLKKYKTLNIRTLIYFFKQIEENDLA